MDYWEAVELLNDITEHRYGSGPLGDQDKAGTLARRRAYNKAVKQGLAPADQLAQIKKALGL